MWAELMWEYQYYSLLVLVSLPYSSYCMVGNFRGVLIFIIFTVDLAVMKTSHPEKL